MEIRDSAAAFAADYPHPDRTAFVMMQFGKTNLHTSIVTAIAGALSSFGMDLVRADDKQYHDDLFWNVLTYVYGSGLGIAVFERIEQEAFNPNVALEVGYMLALGKPVCYLKDRTLKQLHTDLIGKLYREFDPLNAGETITNQLSHWLRDKGHLPSSRRKLSPRQRQVLSLLAQGLTAAEVSGALHIAPLTVEEIAREALDRLNLVAQEKVVYEAARMALDLGWLDEPPT